MRLGKFKKLENIYNTKCNFDGGDLLTGGQCLADDRF